ncbi:MAG: anti-sigma factor, partial [Streptosporangiaceae bacterium]
ASGGSGTVVSSRAQGKAVVLMAGLPELPEGRTYQVWLMGPGTPRSTGLMRSVGGPVLTQGLDDATQLGITVEPAGGSAGPTGAPIFAVGIPA